LAASNVARTDPDALAANQIVPIYYCPSSNASKTFNYFGYAGSGFGFNDHGMQEYIMIAGSDRCPPGFGASCAPLIVDRGNGGPISGGGCFMYTRCHKSAAVVRVATIKDGTSNTMGIGECSGTTKGQHMNAYGGYGDDCPGPYVLSENVSGALDCGWNYLTRTIGPAPNSRWFYNSSMSDGDPRNVIGRLHDSALRSQHTGGIQILLMDGSARFLSENIDLTTFKNLADKDDKQVVGEFCGVMPGGDAARPGRPALDWRGRQIPTAAPDFRGRSHSTLP